MQINNFVGPNLNQPPPTGGYFPPPNGMKPRSLAPIGSGKPPVGAMQTGAGLDHKNSGRY